jgi:hypothetical protein
VHKPELMPWLDIVPDIDARDRAFATPLRCAPAAPSPLQPSGSAHPTEPGPRLLRRSISSTCSCSAWRRSSRHGFPPVAHRQKGVTGTGRPSGPCGILSPLITDLHGLDLRIVSRGASPRMSERSAPPRIRRCNSARWRGRAHLIRAGRTSARAGHVEVASLRG